MKISSSNPFLYNNNLSSNFMFPKTSFFMDPLNLILESNDYQGSLYLGNYEAASDLSILKKHGIGAVLTVAADLGINYPKDSNIIHEVLPALDMPTYNLSRFFNRCHEFIETHRKNTNILVHCLAGISRSATIVITYIMKINNWEFNHSYDYVKKKRKVIFPNPGFIRQMRNYENLLKNKKINGEDFKNSQLKIVSSNPAIRSYSLPFKTKNPAIQVQVKNYENHNVFSFTTGYGNINSNLKTIGGPNVQKIDLKKNYSLTKSEKKQPGNALALANGDNSKNSNYFRLRKH